PTLIMASLLWRRSATIWLSTSRARPSSSTWIWPAATVSEEDSRSMNAIPKTAIRRAAAMTTSSRVNPARRFFILRLLQERVLVDQLGIAVDALPLDPDPGRNDQAGGAGDAVGVGAVAVQIDGRPGRSRVGIARGN